MAVTTLTGTTWTLKSVPDVSTNISVEVGFKYYGNPVEYDGFVVFSNASSIGYYRSSTSSAITVYYDGSWGNENYRTITFTSEVTEGSQSEFIAWLEANQVLPDYIDKVVLPSEEEYNIKDTISGYLTGSDLVAGTNISIEETSEGQLEISTTSSSAAARITRVSAVERKY